MDYFIFHFEMMHDTMIANDTIRILTAKLEFFMSYQVAKKCFVDWFVCICKCTSALRQKSSETRVFVNLQNLKTLISLSIWNEIVSRPVRVQHEAMTTLTPQSGNGLQ